MDRIHVCYVSTVPCDDPEDQMVVAIGREGSGYSQGTPSEGLSGQVPFGHDDVERSPWCVCLFNWQLCSSYSCPNRRVMCLETSTTT